MITADVPLAARAVKAGAVAIAPNGKPFSEDSIGMALATRNLMDQLRSAGAITGGPKPFSPKDRSAFLGSLDREIVRLKRQGWRPGNVTLGVTALQHAVHRLARRRIGAGEAEFAIARPSVRLTTARSSSACALSPAMAWRSAC